MYGNKFEKKKMLWKGLKTFLGGTVLTGAITFFGTAEGADMMNILLPGIPTAMLLAGMRMAENFIKNQ